MRNGRGMSCINGRRRVNGAYVAYESGFDPLSIPGLALWLRADAGLYQERTGASATTPAASDGDPVGSWLDQSGNGRHATAASDAARPTLKLAIQNGMPIVRFDGVNDALVHTLSVTGASTLFAVCKSSLAGPDVQPVFSASAASSDLKCQAMSNISSSDDWGFYAGGWRSAGVGNATFKILGITQDNAGNFELYTDGASSASFSGLAYYSDAHERRIIGGTAGVGEWMLGDVAEIIVYESVLSTADRQAIESYLRSRWGTA